MKTSELITKVVAKAGEMAGIAPDIIMGPEKPARVVAVRDMVAYVLVRTCGLCRHDVAWCMDRRDLSTIHQAIRRAEKRASEKAFYAGLVSRLSKYARDVISGMDESIMLVARRAWFSEDEPPTVGWLDMVHYHLHAPHGYVIKEPGMWICARYVGEDQADDAVASMRGDPGHRTSRIHISSAAGTLAEFPKYLPDGVRWISFQHRGYEVVKVEVPTLLRMLRASKRKDML